MEGASGERVASVRKPENGFWLSPSPKLRQQRVKYTHTECVRSKIWNRESETGWRSSYDPSKEVCVLGDMFRGNSKGLENSTVRPLQKSAPTSADFR